MQVRILKDVFENGSHFDELDNLLTLFRKGKHALFLDDIDDIEAFNHSEWKKGLSSREIKLISAYIKSATKINKANKLINVSLADLDVNFAPREAEMYLAQPLIILLENSEYDPPFTNAIFQHFDDGAIILQAKSDQFWKYGMGGGSAISSVITSELRESFTDPCFTKDKKTYLRYFVILDSDKKYPGMPVDKAKHEALDQNDVPYHILFKREKENYMPLDILKKLNDDYIDLYIAFKKNEQRDFFDLEKGFNLKNYNGLFAEVQELYPQTDVPTEPYKVLRNGLKIEAYKSGKFKKDFSNLFFDASREQLAEVIVHQPKIGSLNEFEYIVSEIKKMI